MNRTNLTTWLAIPKRGYFMQRAIDQGGIMLTVISRDDRVYSREFIPSIWLTQSSNWRMVVSDRLRRARAVLRQAAALEAA